MSDRCELRLCTYQLAADLQRLERSVFAYKRMTLEKGQDKDCICICKHILYPTARFPFYERSLNRATIGWACLPAPLVSHSLVSSNRVVTILIGLVVIGYGHSQGGKLWFHLILDSRGSRSSRLTTHVR